MGIIFTTKSLRNLWPILELIFVVIVDRQQDNAPSKLTLIGFDI